MGTLKNIINNTPVVKHVFSRLSKLRKTKLLTGSGDYWEKRYARGENSGIGSYGKLAEYKADVLNRFVQENNIASVIEFGCGDGNQLTLSHYPAYIGLDVSVSAIKKCMARFKDDRTKSFYLYNSLAFQDNHGLLRAELSISLDVTYHLIEPEVYHAYLDHLFNTARKYVIIYAWDVDGPPKGHVLHRKFSTWIAAHKKNWILVSTNAGIVKDTNASDFYIYKKNNS